MKSVYTVVRMKMYYRVLCSSSDVHHMLGEGQRDTAGQAGALSGAYVSGLPNWD